jgi:hypothetical protein
MKPSLQSTFEILDVIFSIENQAKTAARSDEDYFL